MDRGSPRASDGGQSVAPAAFSRPRRGRCRWPPACHRRRIFSRPGRLCAHPCGHRARPCRRHAARSLSHGGLSHGRPHPADQQDAVRDLSRAGPFRKYVRARAADGCDCRKTQNRSDRNPPPQSHCQERDALRPRLRHARHGNDLRFRRLRWPPRQSVGGGRLGQAASGLATPPRRRRNGRRRIGRVRRKSGLGPFDGVA